MTCTRSSIWMASLFMRVQCWYKTQPLRPIDEEEEGVGKPFVMKSGFPCIQKTGKPRRIDLPSTRHSQLSRCLLGIGRSYHRDYMR